MITDELLREAEALANQRAREIIKAALTRFNKSIVCQYVATFSKLEKLAKTLKKMQRRFSPYDVSPLFSIDWTDDEQARYSVVNGLVNRLERELNELKPCGICNVCRVCHSQLKEMSAWPSKRKRKKVLYQVQKALQQSLRLAQIRRAKPNPAN